MYPTPFVSMLTSTSLLFLTDVTPSFYSADNVSMPRTMVYVGNLIHIRADVMFLHKCVSNTYIDAYITGQEAIIRHLQLLDAIVCTRIASNFTGGRGNGSQSQNTKKETGR